MSHTNMYSYTHEYAYLKPIVLLKVERSRAAKVVVVIPSATAKAVVAKRDAVAMSLIGACILMVLVLRRR